MDMNELLQLIAGNPDLPVLAALVIFSIVRINSIDRKVSAVCARVDILENHILTLRSNHTIGEDKRPKTKISVRE